MLAEGRTHTATRTSRWLALVAVGLFLCSGLLAVPTQGELPTPYTNANATRTVSWVMNDSTGLSTSGVSFAGGIASLSWTAAPRNWSRTSDFEANQSRAVNLTMESTGLALGANLSNRLANGTFSSAAPWTYTDGTDDNTTARWIPSEGAVELNHTSGPTAFLWDSFTSVVTTWSPIASAGSTSSLYQAPYAMGDFVNVSQGVAQWAGAQHIGNVNWSAYDQLRVGIFQNASASAAFNISAYDSASHFQTTAAIPLSVGWQTVTVDLDQLGSDLSILSYLTLRIVSVGGQKLPPLNYNFAGLQLGKAKQADTTARVSQVFNKANTTTPLSGSAYLSFDWMIENFTGVAEARFGANLTGPSGTFVTVFPSTYSLGWRHFTADVSSYTAAHGPYNLSFSLQIVLDNITASNVTAFVDNAEFIYPDRGNGSFLSKPISMVNDSRYLSLSWAATFATPITSIHLGFRTGNSTSGMGGWSEFSSPATYLLTLYGLYFQVRADLNTTNASLSPVLSTFSLETSHRASMGIILSGNYTAQSDFLSWRSLRPDQNVIPSTSLSFSVGDGSSWSPWQGENLSSLGIGSRIQWKAVLQTSDGLLSPALANVSLVYDYLGPPVRVVFLVNNVAFVAGATLNMTAGASVPLGLAVFDAGSHPVPATAYNLGWGIDNGTGGSVFPNGTYTAGKPGSYVVTATVAPVVGGAVVHATLRVKVSPSQGSSTLPSSLWDYWPIFIVAIAALAGFSIYEVVIRRLYAIDDVFLIAKDGRLIMHNTRRMRADRDEDILSGMLTAIMAFLRDQDPEENGELKRFQVGGKTTLLERGEYVYLNAIYSGRVPGWAGKDLHRFMTDLEDKFGDAFATWTGSPEDLRDLKEYMQRFVSHVRYHGDSHARDTAN